MTVLTPLRSSRRSPLVVAAVASPGTWGQAPWAQSQVLYERSGSSGRSRIKEYEYISESRVEGLAACGRS